MSDDAKPDPEIDTVMQLLVGETGDQKFLSAGFALFALTLGVSWLKERYPDLVSRKTLVEQFIMHMQQRTDQELAHARNMLENSTLGKIFSGVIDKPDELSENTERRMQLLRERLMELIK